MKPTLKIYDAQFQGEIKRMLAHVRSTGRGPAKALNAEAYHLAVATINHTRRARRESIEALGLKTKTVTPYTTSRGFQRFKRTFSFEKDNAVANYLAALKSHGVTAKKVSKNLRQLIKRRKGSTFISGAQANAARNIYFSSRSELEQRARRWIAKKLRSIGFLASTWRLVARKFDIYAKDKARENIGGPIKSGKPNDSSADGSKRATGQSLVAVLALKIGRDKYGNTLRDYAAKLMRDALQLAINERTGKIQRRMAHEIKEGMKADGFAVKP